MTFRQSLISILLFLLLNGWSTELLADSDLDERRAYCQKKTLETLERIFAEKHFLGWRQELLERSTLEIKGEFVVKTSDVDARLMVIRCDASAFLLWVVPRLEDPIVQLPLSGINQWLDFLSIMKVEDLDLDKSLEAFLVGTGGAGMYFHFPMVLRLLSNGRWKVILHCPDRFFYGQSKILPPDHRSGLRLEVRSVDEEAPWVFGSCSLCNHPLKIETFDAARGLCSRGQRHPVQDKQRTLSDFILAVWKNDLESARHLISKNAAIGHESGGSEQELQKGLTEIGLTPIPKETTCLTPIPKETTCRGADAENSFRYYSCEIIYKTPIDGPTVFFRCGCGDWSQAYCGCKNEPANFEAGFDDSREVPLISSIKRVRPQ